MVNQTKYIPDSGDIIWVDFSPVKGHEQGGYRPALVITPQYYSMRSNIALLCPITSREKGYPFEVSFKGKKSEGVVLIDQIKAIDFSVRKIKFIEKIDDESLLDIKAKLHSLID